MARRCNVCETVLPDEMLKPGALCIDVVACVRRSEAREHRAIRTRLAGNALVGLMARPDMDRCSAQDIARRAADVADALFIHLYPETVSGS